MTTVAARAARRRRAQAFGTWTVAIAILAYLLLRVSPNELARDLARGPWLLLVGYVCLQGLVTLLADAAATRVALEVLGTPMSALRVLRIRGISYLLGIVNYALGQGGVGFQLLRKGVAPGRVTALVLLLLATNVTVLGTVAAAALAIAPPPGTPPWLPAVLGVAVVLALGAMILAPRLRGVVERRILRHLAVAGSGGISRALLARVPHVVLLILSHWGALRLWGIGVPATDGMLRVPLVLLIVALPVTPSGIGTAQAAQVAFFGAFAPGATAGDRESFVLAFSLAYAAIGLVVQALIGWICLVWSRRVEEAG